jgi:hypothetical protein
MRQQHINTEEVTGSIPVSPTSITAGQSRDPDRGSSHDHLSVIRSLVRRLARLSIIAMVIMLAGLSGGLRGRGPGGGGA